MFARIIARQLRHKWVINLLLFLTLTSLVSLYVFILNTNRFSARSMQLIMKNMGLNQLIIPQSQAASDTYLCTENQVEFPDEVTRQAASHVELMSRYYLSVLQERLSVTGGVVVLTGIQPVQRVDETQEKGNPVRPVKSGMVRLGSAAATALGAQEGGSVEIKGRSFDVAAIATEQGTLDDCRVFLKLADLQDLLGKPGKINAILSFECLEIGGSLEQVHKYQRENLARVLPGYKLINIESIARGRYYARRMTDKYQVCLLGLVAFITVLIIVITGFQEVAERKYETGILVAQGAGYLYIMGLYLAKTLVLTVIASVAGFLIGGGASVLLTTPFLATQTREVTILWGNLTPTVMRIGVIALLAELIPMIKLVRMDPCAIVMEE
jgi:ABC-type lipoprotein release transport system permease subunit